jgi:hypothetical protein
MSNKSVVLGKILSMDKIILSQEQKKHDSSALKKLNKAFELLRNIGLIEGIQMEGRDKRYFLIDGTTWRRACNELNQPSTPNFILWEEADFFTFIENIVRDSKH